jgi:YD repeat-containing protein
VALSHTSVNVMKKDKVGGFHELSEKEQEEVVQETKDMLFDLKEDVVDELNKIKKDNTKSLVQNKLNLNRIIPGMSFAEEEEKSNEEKTKENKEQFHEWKDELKDFMGNVEEFGIESLASEEIQKIATSSKISLADTNATYKAIMNETKEEMYDLREDVAKEFDKIKGSMGGSLLEMPTLNSFSEEGKVEEDYDESGNLVSRTTTYQNKTSVTEYIDNGLVVAIETESTDEEGVVTTVLRDLENG